MIQLKNAHQLRAMQEAGAIASGALRVAGEAVKPGVTTGEIDRLVYEYITKAGATPSFLNYNGYPASACISINEEVIHGIPGKRKIQEGDIVSLDIGACYHGFHGDNAATFAAGEVSSAARMLMDTTRECLEKGIAAAVSGARLGDVGHAVQTLAESRGFSVVTQFVGHGVGRHLHEEPDVPNFGHPGHGVRLVPGMVIAIEPMINEGTSRVKALADGWTEVTLDGRLSAHFENTVAITQEGPVILTRE